MGQRRIGIAADAQRGTIERTDTKITDRSKRIDNTPKRDGMGRQKCVETGREENFMTRTTRTIHTIYAIRRRYLWILFFSHVSFVHRYSVAVYTDKTMYTRLGYTDRDFKTFHLIFKYLSQSIIIIIIHISFEKFYCLFFKNNNCLISHTK